MGPACGVEGPGCQDRTCPLLPTVIGSEVQFGDTTVMELDEQETVDGVKILSRTLNLQSSAKPLSMSR